MKERRQTNGRQTTGVVVRICRLWSIVRCQIMKERRQTNGRQTTGVVVRICGLWSIVRCQIMNERETTDERTTDNRSCCQDLWSLVFGQSSVVKL